MAIMTIMLTDDIKRELEGLADPTQAKNLMRFFKTGPGQYGEGDSFRGIKVPQIRKLVAQSAASPLESVLPFLTSRWHEDRLFALLSMVHRFSKGDDTLKEQIYTLYLAHTASVNNWDLVDLSAERISGAYLYSRDRSPLYRLAGSRMLWERRIALLSTFYFIRKGDFADTLRLVEQYCSDPEDLIHKASGWMLREIGKRNSVILEQFLAHHLDNLPRTTLRYAIERFPEVKRMAYLKGTVRRQGAT